jgi:Lon-like protease
VVTGVLFVVAVAVAILLPVPYVVLGPGVTLNTLGDDPNGKPILTITGGEVRDTSGNLNLTTVSVSGDNVNALQALAGWLRGDQIVVPRASVYPPGQTEQQTNQQNAQDFTDSQNTAEAAAFCELGYPEGFGVLSVTSANAKKALKPGDQLVSVDGQAVDSPDSLRAVLAKQTPGDTVQVQVTRADKPLTLPVVLSKPVQGSGGASIGIGVGDACLAPYQIDFGLADEIGGPSAGLMFALGIVDKIGPDDVTDGRFIAGTGTIDSDGKVGPIGGIQLKMIAAKDAGATVFLAPADNCADVRGNIPDGLDVVKVTTLKDALSSLATLESGGSVPHC